MANTWQGEFLWRNLCEDGDVTRAIWFPLHCTQNVTNTAKQARRKGCPDRDRQGGSKHDGQ